MDTLYSIDSALLAVIEDGFVVDEETGEILFSSDGIDELVATREEKLEACAVVVKTLEAKSAALKDESRKLQERAKSAENQAKRLKNYILDSMHFFGDRKVETTMAVLSLRRTKRVEVDDDKLADVWFQVKMTKTPDKTAIRKAIESGETIEGAEIVESDSLQVK